MPVTIQQLATNELGRKARTVHDYQEIGLPVFGGCELCRAAIACDNAYPSRSGYIRCKSCLGKEGWDSVEDAALDVFGAAKA
jgi:hypothetical protein